MADGSSEAARTVLQSNCLQDNSGEMYSRKAVTVGLLFISIVFKDYYSKIIVDVP